MKVETAAYDKLVTHNMKSETSDVKQIMELETSQIMQNDAMVTSDDGPITEMKSFKRKNKYGSMKGCLYYCPFCDKVGHHKNNMRMHIQSHTDERPFQCSSCDKGYRKSSSLKEHHRRVHLGEPARKQERKNKSQVLKFKCEICTKAFSHKISLERHLRSHFNEYVFKCDLCDQRFRHDSTFNRHKKTVHQSAVQMNKCHICNKTLKGCKSDLKKHIKTHLKESKNMHRLEKKPTNTQEDHKDTVRVKEEHDPDNDLHSNKIEFNGDAEHTKSGKADAQQDSATKVTSCINAVFDLSNGCKNVAATSLKVQDSEYARHLSEEDAPVSYDSCGSNEFHSDTEDEAEMGIECHS